MACALRIGLTGGMGSGKSEAARRFAAHGIPVIDTDAIARELVTPGQPALEEIIDVFGREILTESGHLDRARLRERVFSDVAQRHQLEDILHPRIRDAATRQVRASAAPYCLLVIPLLLETAQRYPLDRILVIDTPRELQYQRVARRDGLSDREITAILATQVDRQQRLDAADDTLLNDSDIATLHARVDDLHRIYLELADSSRSDHP